MNSRDNQSYSASGPSKRQPGASQAQKVVVACDQCLLLQIRCRFNPAEQDKCRSCTVRDSECAWTQVPKPRPPPDSSYIEYLETRVKELEKHLKDMFPGINAKREIDTLLSPQSASGDPQLPSVGAGLVQWGNVGSSSMAIRSIPPSTTASTPATSRLVQQVRLANTRNRLVSADTNGDDTVWDATSSTRQDQPRYHGQSSSEVLSRDASIFRNGYHSNRILSAVPATHRRVEFWRPTPAEIRLLKQDPWETEDGLALELPPDDLLRILLDAYFDHTLFPIIHRPLFEKQLNEGLHKRNGVFLRVVLLVCANGARWCDDPRVLDDRWPVPLSAGHQWFRQFKPWHKTFVDQISLWDAQLIVLSAMFFFGASASYGTWTVVGTGIRMMQDVGAHRKKSHQSLENELYKRCFWSLIFLDRLQSITLGRHGAMQDLDSDLDDVLEVDDELWSLEPNAPPPAQPTGVPAKLSGFNQLIGLCRIADRCLQTVFALEQTKRQIGLSGPEGSAWMFNDINTQLNMWARDVPSHLQLPNPADYATMPGFSGAVALWGVYYDIVISVNRTFITRASSPLAAPSMRLCREAARACANMIDAHRRIHGSRLLPSTYYPAFSSAMALVVDLIAECKIQRLGSQAGTLAFDASMSTNYTTQQKEEDMIKCMRVLEEGEKYFHIAGRLHDIVREFEESWRLQISPYARSASSGRESGIADSPSSGSSQAHLSSSTQLLPFQPTDSVLPPLSRPSNKSRPAIDSGIDAGFDIAYDPPDTTPAPDPTPRPPSPGQAAPTESTDYEYARHTAYADEMFYGLCASDTSRPAAFHQPGLVGPTASDYQRHRSWQGTENQPSFIGARLGGLQPYMPEYGYNAVDAPKQHAQRLASSLGSEPSTPGAFVDNTTGLNTASTVIPGLGVFSPGMWTPTFSGAIHAPSYAKKAGEPVDSRTMSESVAGTGEFMRAQWDATMQNTLSLNKRQFNPQHKS